MAKRGHKKVLNTEMEMGRAREREREGGKRKEHRHREDVKKEQREGQ
jgi:hypothetical protein